MSAGEELRDVAMGRVEANASTIWKEKAADCLDWLIANRDEWTTDDFWNAMAEHYPEYATHDHRALGPLIASLIRARRIEKAGLVPSDRAVRHKGFVFKYRGFQVRSVSADTTELANLLYSASYQLTVGYGARDPWAQELARKLSALGVRKAS